MLNSRITDRSLSLTWYKALEKGSFIALIEASSTTISFFQKAKTFIPFLSGAMNKNGHWGKFRFPSWNHNGESFAFFIKDTAMAALKK